MAVVQLGVVHNRTEIQCLELRKADAVSVFATAPLQLYEGQGQAAVHSGALAHCGIHVENAVVAIAAATIREIWLRQTGKRPIN